jgi:hypothetical protein
MKENQIPLQKKYRKLTKIFFNFRKYNLITFLCLFKSKLICLNFSFLNLNDFGNHNSKLSIQCGPFYFPIAATSDVPTFSELVRIFKINLNSLQFHFPIPRQAKSRWAKVDSSQGEQEPEWTRVETRGPQRKCSTEK